MKNYSELFLIFLCITVILSMGCTNQTAPVASAPVSTPPSYVPTITLPPILTITIDPVITQQALTGKLVITLPPSGCPDNPKIRRSSVSIDGNVVGTATSNGATEFVLNEGEYSVLVDGFAVRLVTIKFAKPENEQYFKEQAYNEPACSGGGLGDNRYTGEGKITNNIEGPRSFSGNGDSIQKFGVSDGGYIFTGTYRSQGNFIVHITDTNGNTVDFLFNELGPYSGSKIANLKYGQYYLSVKATGPFAIDMMKS